MELTPEMKSSLADIIISRLKELDRRNLAIVSAKLLEASTTANPEKLMLELRGAAGIIAGVLK